MSGSARLGRVIAGVRSGAFQDVDARPVLAAGGGAQTGAGAAPVGTRTGAASDRTPGAVLSDRARVGDPPGSAAVELTAAAPTSVAESGNGDPPGAWRRPPLPAGSPLPMGCRSRRYRERARWGGSPGPTCSRRLAWPRVRRRRYPRSVDLLRQPTCPPRRAGRLPPRLPSRCRPELVVRRRPAFRS
jgi:hypothetical protein